MTPDQVKAARLLLGWSMSRLGMRSGTSVHTVRSFEQTGRIAAMYGRTDQVDAVAAIRATLEAAGIEFTDGDAPGGAAAETGPMTPDQVKAARTLLGWSRTRLSTRSRTSIHMVRTFERTGRVTPLYIRERPTDPVAAVRATLEAAGIEFTNGDPPSVLLRKQSS